MQFAWIFFFFFRLLRWKSYWCIWVRVLLKVNMKELYEICNWEYFLFSFRFIFCVSKFNLFFTFLFFFRNWSILYLSLSNFFFIFLCEWNVMNKIIYITRSFILFFSFFYFPLFLHTLCCYLSFSWKCINSIRNIRRKKNLGKRI